MDQDWKVCSSLMDSSSKSDLKTQWTTVVPISSHRLSKWAILVSPWVNSSNLPKQILISLWEEETI
jgi:hypothetical protein